MKSKSDTGTEKKDSNGFSDIEWKGEPSDFDGHTDFHKMTFTEKLEWLSEAVVSVYLLAKENPEAGCSSLFKT